MTYVSCTNSKKMVKITDAITLCIPHQICYQQNDWLMKKNKEEICCHKLHGNNCKYLITTYKLKRAFFWAYICKDMAYKKRQVCDTYMSVYMPPLPPSNLWLKWQDFQTTSYKLHAIRSHPPSYFLILYYQ